MQISLNQLSLVAFLGLALVSLASPLDADAQAVSAVKAGSTFRDCSDCPEMVSIPAGSFMMGSPESETGRRSNEGPQRRVSVPAFAAGKYEVTWAEWDRCVAAGSCASLKADGFGGGSRPVTMVSWYEAVAYTKWLSSKTGQTYRLLSESEWEYAARAGTTTPFSFGSTISTSQANYDGRYAYGTGSRGESRKMTTAVGTFPANAFGLHDMHGNVWEWVQDCIWAGGNYSYPAGQPSNGSAFTSGTCGNSSINRVYRGGSWNSDPQDLRSASRRGSGPRSQSIIYGFRVARTLSSTP